MTTIETAPRFWSKVGVLTRSLKSHLMFEEKRSPNEGASALIQMQLTFFEGLYYKIVEGFNNPVQIENQRRIEEKRGKKLALTEEEIENARQAAKSHFKEFENNGFCVPPSWKN